MNKSFHKVFSAITIFALVLMALPMQSAQADNTVQNLPFSQDWTDIGQITADDNWSGVLGIIGYRGDALTGATGVDPQTVVADGTSTPVDVTANQANPNTFTTGGIAEFHLANPVVAFQGSGTARAPFLLLHLNTTGSSNITVSYNLRDIDGSVDNSIQPVALQFRVGSSGNFTNVPAGFVADATTGPSLATLVTPVSAVLPPSANNQPLLQVRVITTDAVGSDELVGVDDVSIFGSVEDFAPSVASTSPTNGAANVAVDSNITVNFSEAVDVAAGTITVECPASTVVASNIVADNVSSVVIDPASDLPFSTTCAINVSASGVTDEDANDPPNEMDADFSSSFVTSAPTPTSEVVISQVYGGGGNAGATYKNDFIELYNRSASPVTLTGWSVQYASATGTTWTNKTDLSGIIQPGQYYLIQEAAGAGGTVDLPAPNATGNIAMSGTAGKVALVNSTTALAGTGCPFAASVIDFVGYGTTANCFETAPTGTLSNTTAALRNGNGATDTDNNSADFTVGAPNPRNTPPPNPNLTISDVSASEGNSGTTSFDFTVSLSGPAPAGGVTFDIATADNTATIADNDYAANSLTGQSIAAGSSTYMFSVLVNGDATDEGSDETFFVNVSNVTGAILVDGQGVGTIVNDDVDVCTQSFTPIYNIQGSGSAAAITGNVSTEGVVVGDFEGTAAASGFYIQDLSGDGNAATSDGIFVFTGASNLASVGDVVRVTGFARERFNQTTLNGSNSDSAPVTNIVNCDTGSVPVTDVTLPFASATFAEQYEGMLVRFPQPLVIAEYFNYGRFGEVVLALPLAGESRPFSGTAIDEPGAPANARTAANALSRITLDDAQSAQNPSTLRHPNGLAFSLSNLFRGGDTVENAVGVLGFDFSLYRIIPTGPADYTSVNPRPASPDPVGGTLRVAAMNTLNFFVTLDTTASDSGSGPCGALQNLDCRGADSVEPNEFTRQRDKLLTALLGLDADVIGLNELESTPGAEPLISITSGMPGYDYIDTGPIGTDAIKVGIIYRPAVVTPIGPYQILDSTDDPRFIDTRSRPALAQTFEEIATGARFTVVVNHLKSKGSACSGDPDAGDGQGNCNGTRTLAAQALVDWLAADPTGSGDPDFLIMGDLNSYAQEDPIDAIKAGSDDMAGTSDDFTNLIFDYHGPYAYSYTFDGQAGYLDHALANASLADQITGAAEWHINSDEPTVLDYDTSFKPPAQEALFELNQYRTSDHDAVVVGLNLTEVIAPTVTIDQAAGQDDPTGTGPINFTVVFSESVTGFDSSDVSLSGTAGATTAVVTGGPATYNVAVSGMTANGTVIASIPANAAEDAAGNDSTASSSTDNTVTYNNTAPTVVVTAGGMCGSSGGTMNLTVNDSEGDTLLLSGSSSNAAAVPNANIVFGGSGSNRTVTITAVPAATVRTAVVTITVNDGISTSSVTITVLVGTSGNNMALNGTSGADLILGLDGNDTLNGLAGNDLLCGGAKNDILNGGANDDTLRGEAGNDSLTGSTGADLFSGGPGNDSNTDFNAGQGDTTDGT